MYSIFLYERGRFCTAIGGPLPTLPEAIDQLKAITKTLQTTELNGYFGFTFDRAGTECQIVVADRWGAPIKKVEGE